MFRSPFILIPLAALAVAVACSSEERKPPPNPGRQTTSSGAMTGGGAADGGGGAADGGGGQGGGGHGGAADGGGGAADGGGGAESGGGGQGGDESVPTCRNGVMDGGESDVDCGGDCDPCRADQRCAVPADCYSGRCEPSGEESRCAAASCENGVIDGDETDVDCGGGEAPLGDNPACAPCADLKRCDKGADCDSRSCVGNRCLPPSCSDGVKNGSETDVDCGGLCGRCAPGAACVQSTDCRELVCLDGVCLPPSCSDGVKNGTETDIDCGGKECGTRCPAGQRCGTSADCATSICDTSRRVCACPPSMVIAPVTGGGSYCIDAYEVTKQEYDAFLMANPGLAGLPPQCAGNVYVPSNDWPYTEGREPVTYVDWCDAYAYCTYVGKHLCGKIGGGHNATESANNPLASEWFNACSGQGVNEYPYGHRHDGKVGEDGLCADRPGDPISRKPGPPNPPPPVPICEGGVSDLYNMSGNVAEWENSCDSTGKCLVRGGSRMSLGSEYDARVDALMKDELKEDEEKEQEKEQMTRELVGCAAYDARDATTTRAPDIGFRCCL